MRPSGRTEVRRWDLVWELLPYVLLVACATAAAINGGVAGMPVTAVLAALVAAWHWWMVSAHPDWPGQLGRMSLYYAVLVGLVWLIAERELVFLPLVVACCAMAFVALPGWWAYVGVGAASLVAAALNDGLSPLGRLVVFVSWALAASFFGAMFRFMEGQVVRRREMIEELRRANTRLTALSRENAELQAQVLRRARQAGALEERQRLAREIHDTIAQGLAAIVTQVEAAEEEGPDPGAARRRLRTVRLLARDSLAEARRSVRALRPGPLDKHHLPDAVRHSVAAWSRHSGVAATVTVTGDAGRLHPEVEVTGLRVVQEALANVAKHAAAARVGVTLTYLDDALVVDVRDDGAGFDPTAPPKGDGFGLAAMRQRVDRLAGRLELESAPGRGTALSAALPAVPVDGLAGDG